ncbi:MAG: O-antigen ligase family protein [Planctomycetaceae bacterium]|nr:O-antigen ligase family protein [Planctomycetaceae bacterium]
MATDRESTPSVAAPEEHDPWFLLPICLGGLLTWRWMQPVESAILGETLWIAQVSLLLPILCAIWYWKDRTASIVWSWWDFCLWLVITGHWCSLFWLFSTGGQLRSAFNLCWEWTAIGCTFFALRQSVRSSEARSDLIRLLLVLGVCMAGLGVWQHFVSYRWVLADYQSIQQSYDDLMNKADSRGLSRLEQQELRSLQAEFQTMNVPLDGSSREMFERRLADNRQPVGRWALTNSLGGWLAILVVLFAAGWLENSGRRSVLLFGLALVLVCLWATHSRTAQVATVIGLILLGIERWASPGRVRMLRLGFLVSLAIVGGGAILWGIGGIDQIDFTSNFALRSLQFRLQYWVGSLRALFDSPWFGTGPGNFRQVYLHYKLPASSEQIADPHNAWLDVWANGGLSAMMATVTACVLFVKRYCNSSRRAEVSAVEVTFMGWLSSPWFLGAEIALVGAFLTELITTGYADWELVAFVVAVPMLDAVLKKTSANLGTVILMICAIVLGVHLMGAGGMEMPGIVLIGLCLVAAAMGTEKPCCAVSLSKDAALIAASLLFVSLMWITTTLPVSRAGRLLETAQSNMYGGERVVVTRKNFLQATEADPYDPEPWRVLGEFEYAIWQTDPDQVTFLKSAMEAWQEAFLRDPHAYRDHFRRAEAYWSAFEQLKILEYAIKAEKFYALANELMPHDEKILSGWALAAEAANLPEKSHFAAKKAIEIHELSRKNGHWEKMLSDEKYEEMKNLLQDVE